jgi:RNA polymerase sigma-70 factor (ECF subfamily)
MPELHDSDQTGELLEQASRHRPEAVEALLARHRPWLRQVVELRLDRRVRGRVDPSDVVQEAQMEASRRLQEYLCERPVPFRLWLRQLAYERLLMLHRRHVGAVKRSVEREVGLPDGSSALLGRQLVGAGSPSERLAEEELARRVHQAVERLGERDREVILLRNFEGLTNQEAALVLGVKPDTASQRYGRALLRLRQALLDAESSEESP